MKARKGLGSSRPRVKETKAGRRPISIFYQAKECGPRHSTIGVKCLLSEIPRAEEQEYLCSDLRAKGLKTVPVNRSREVLYMELEA